jgi:hypothetical protein
VRALVKAHHRPAVNDVLVLVGGNSLAEKRTAIKTLSESAAPTLRVAGGRAARELENRISRHHFKAGRVLRLRHRGGHGVSRHRRLNASRSNYGEDDRHGESHARLHAEIVTLPHAQPR